MKTMSMAVGLAAAAFWALAGSAQANIVTFHSGTTVLESQGDFEVLAFPTGTAQIGDTGEVSFSYDLGLATPTAPISPDATSYQLPVTNFSATFGGASFTLDPAAAFGTLSLAYNNNQVAAALFSFTGVPNGTDPIKSLIFPTSFTTLDLIFILPPNPGATGISTLPDLKTSYFGAFIFGVFADSPTTPAGALIGTLAVPEMGTWAMMIIGFGVIGSTMRSRRKAAATPAFA